VGAPYDEPILPDATVASAQLAQVVDQPIAAADLADLRRLQQAAVRAAEAILAGAALDCAEFNALAAGSYARVELIVTTRVPRRELIWTDTSLAAPLARRLLDELTALEPDRLRRCARPECELLFCDTTRSRTRRWHAEDPLRMARASTRPPAEDVTLSSTPPTPRSRSMRRSALRVARRRSVGGEALAEVRHPSRS
jgi:predicted RNA-binding Zn ribbon-like protein